LTISPSVVDVGSPVTISARLDNDSGVFISRDEPVFVNGDEIDVLLFDTPAGDTQTVSTEYTPTSPGTYEVQVRDLAETFTAQTTAEGEIIVIGIDADRLPVVVGEPNDILVTAENVGDARTQETFDVLVDSIPSGTVSFDLSPGEIEVDSVPWTPSEAKVYDVDVGTLREAFTVQSDDEPPVEPPTEVSIGAVAVVGGAALLLLLSRRKRGS
jgi:hypothetical protein